jgi:hypothetical protein
MSNNEFDFDKDTLAYIAYEWKHCVICNVDGSFADISTNETFQTKSDWLQKYFNISEDEYTKLIDKEVTK